MEKSHKIYNLIFDFLLAAGVCFYNDLRFMRVWFLGGQLYHSVGFANYRFGLVGKEVCWDFSPLNILHCLQGYDPVSYTHLDVYKRQRRCRAAAAGAVLKPSGGNCAVLP